MNEPRKMYCIHGTFPDHCGACRGQLIASLRERIAALEAEIVNRKEAFEAQWKLHNEHARGWCERIATLEKDVQCWKALCEFYKQWVIDADMPIPAPPEEQGK